MADNVAVTEGSGKTIATDDVGGFQYQRIKIDNGADGVAGGDVCSANPLPVIGKNPVPMVASGSGFTRPADTTAYAAGDLVANSTVAGSVVLDTVAVARNNDEAFTLLRCRLQKSGTTITNASFRVHVYSAAPTFTNGDNGWMG
jgi:hypothetical protein